MEEPRARLPKGSTMPDPTAQRTLVKSPPELWAEVSDPESLARHLAEFGEIRITRVEPETIVAWEGEKGSGTVQIDPSGWGTKVTITASVPEPVVVEPEPEPEPVAVVGAHAAGGGGSAEPVAVEPEPEPVAAVEPDVEAVAYTPPSAVEMLERAGFFSRLFGRQRMTGEIPEAPPEPEPEISPPLTPVPDPEPEPDEEPPLPEPTPLPERDPDPTPPAANVEQLLSDVLDSLGSAHHRPFSRQ